MNPISISVTEEEQHLLIAGLLQLERIARERGNSLTALHAGQLKDKVEKAGLKGTQ